MKETKPMKYIGHIKEGETIVKGHKTADNYRTYWGYETQVTEENDEKFEQEKLTENMDGRVQKILDIVLKKKLYELL